MWLACFDPARNVSASEVRVKAKHHLISIPHFPFPILVPDFTGENFYPSLCDLVRLISDIRVVVVCLSKSPLAVLQEHCKNLELFLEAFAC